jgi:TRAP-type C4-dicarboxylate transport system permease small subunit
MKGWVKNLKRVSTALNATSGIIVFFMMFLTVTDVVMRFFGKPILGSYELVSFLGAIVIGFAIPKTSFDRGHVYVDFLSVKWTEATQKLVFIITRIPNIAFFVALAVFLVLKSRALYRAGEISSILQIPRYPLVLLLAFCCFVQCAVLIADIARTMAAEDSHE